MDIDRFIEARNPRWRRLEELLALADASPAWEIGRERIQELVRLYRLACSDLNQARTYTANPELLERLNNLTGRGYRFVYGESRRRTVRESAARFFLREIPATFRRERVCVMAAALPLVFGAIVGFAAVALNPANAERLIPPEFFTESPRARVERIEHGEERIDTLDKAAALGAFLYTHNIQVSFLVFSLGALTIVGGIALLFYNGVLLGAVAGTYYLDGVHVFFLAWVGPHGALEIPAIVFGGAAGLRAGRALLLPGDRSVASSLRASFPNVWRMMVLTVVVLVLAGLIEGSFSQLSAVSFPYSIKIGAAAVLFFSLFAFLFLRWMPEEGSGL